jgi:hypothetical protein
MHTKNTIRKSYAIVSMREPRTDFAHWQSLPLLTRLAALEQVRMEYHQWRYGAEPRLQRVYSIVQR